jgi:hypothetical protein
MEEKSMKTSKMKWLFLLTVSIILIAGQGGLYALTVKGKVTCAPSGGVPLGAKVEVYDIDPLPGNTYHIDAAPLATDYVNASGDFTLTFTWPSGDPYYEFGGPDLVFKVHQNIDGTVETIYGEDAADAHWNAVDNDYFDIKVTSSKAVCAVPGSVPIGGNDFMFTRIGSSEIDKLSKGQNNPASIGYYRATADGYVSQPKANGTDIDQPFGASLVLFGWFGTDSDATCYQVKYRYKAQGEADWSLWFEYDQYLASKWKNNADNTWITEKLGPYSPGPAGSPTNLFRVPYRMMPGKTWTYLDRVVIFDTKNVPDGLCEIKVEGYTWQGSNTAAVPAKNLDNNLPDSKITVRVDNTAPTVKILKIKRNGYDTNVCDILDLNQLNDKVEVEVCVWDQNGHLGNYTLHAMFGHDCVVRPLPRKPKSPDNAADNYKNNAAGSPSWKGKQNYTVTYYGNDYGTCVPGNCDCKKAGCNCYQNVMPSCAYQFRLTATKRTTDGSSLLKWDEDTWHVTIQRN